MENSHKLTYELEAYLRERSRLRMELKERWVVFAHRTFQCAFDDYEPAARFAVERFSGLSFLVRHLDINDEQVPLLIEGREP